MALVVWGDPTLLANPTAALYNGPVGFRVHPPRPPILLHLLLASALAADPIEVRGTLAPGDGRMDSGEWIDVYALPCAAGAMLSARATSSAFDTYVGLDMPGQDTIQNDDATFGEGALANGQVIAAGTCDVFVTSYKAGEVGDYVLQLTGFSGPPTLRPPTVAPATPAVAATPLGAQLDALLRAWGEGFHGHLGGPFDDGFGTPDTFTTDLTLEGASRILLRIPTAGTAAPRLIADLGQFADEAAGLRAYKAWVDKVGAGGMPCCTFLTDTHDTPELRCTTWLPNDPSGRMGALSRGMLEVTLKHQQTWDDAAHRATWAWVLGLSISRLP